MGSYLMKAITITITVHIKNKVINIGVHKSTEIETIISL